MSESSIPISVIVMTKNEEANITKCLRWLQRFSEVFVVDSASVDQTVPRAAALGAHIVQFDWNGKYPKKKQWCLENLRYTNKWVLYVDADEEMTPQLARECHTSTLNSGEYAAFFVPLDYVFLGKRLAHGHKVLKIALLDRTRARFPVWNDLQAENMWEVEGHYQPEIDGRVGVLKWALVHDDRDSLYHYFDRHNRYSDWEVVCQSNSQPLRSNRLGLRGQLEPVFQRMPLRWLALFLYQYVLRLGALDGLPGLHYAVAGAFYQWQIAVKIEERRLTRRRKVGRGHGR